MGTFHPVYDVNGQRTQIVLPGAETVMFEPCPIEIPAGATFYVKCFASWNGSFWLGRSQACIPALGEWTHRGVGLSDETTTSTVFPATALAAGFPSCRLREVAEYRCCPGHPGCEPRNGLRGNSSDPDTGALFIGRAMGNLFPVINLSRAGDSLGQYLYQSAARRELSPAKPLTLSSRWVATIFSPGIPFEKTLSWLQRAAEPYLADGVLVYGMTVLPRHVQQ